MYTRTLYDTVLVNATRSYPAWLQLWPCDRVENMSRKAVPGTCTWIGCYLVPSPRRSTSGGGCLYKLFNVMRRVCWLLVLCCIRVHGYCSGGTHHRKPIGVPVAPCSCTICFHTPKFSTSQKKLFTPRLSHRSPHSPSRPPTCPPPAANPGSDGS